MTVIKGRALSVEAALDGIAAEAKRLGMHASQVSLLPAPDGAIEFSATLTTPLTPPPGRVA